MQYSDTNEHICADCIGNDDLQKWIATWPVGSCSFCDAEHVSVVDFDDLLERVEEVIFKHFSRAVDELPQDPEEESGYFGTTFDTQDVLDTLGLDFPGDHDNEIRGRVWRYFNDHEPWCELDWTVLDDKAALVWSWEQFCEAIKHERRFFFLKSAHNNNDESEEFDRDHVSFNDLLQQIATLSEKTGLIKTLPVGTLLYRGRTYKMGDKPTTALQLGPPPPDMALQSNRMNPPGIPMMYVADTKACALKELGILGVGELACVASFEVAAPLRILDYSKLPPAPGHFSKASRRKILLHQFLRHFVREIIKPVARDDRNHLDYLRSQVVTEYLRDYAFVDGSIHGVRYPSTVTKQGTNVVLFGGPELVDPSPSPWPNDPDNFLRLVAIDGEAVSQDERS